MKILKDNKIFLFLVILTILMIRPVNVSAATLDKPEKYLDYISFLVNAKKLWGVIHYNEKYKIYRKDDSLEPESGGYIATKVNADYSECKECDIEGDGEHLHIEPYHITAKLGVEAEIYTYDGKKLGVTKPRSSSFVLDFKKKRQQSQVYYCRLRVIAKYINSGKTEVLTTWSDKIYTANLPENI